MREREKTEPYNRRNGGSLSNPGGDDFLPVNLERIESRQLPGFSRPYSDKNYSTFWCLLCPLPLHHPYHISVWRIAMEALPPTPCTDPPVVNPPATGSAPATGSSPATGSTPAHVAALIAAAASFFFVALQRLLLSMLLLRLSLQIRLLLLLQLFQLLF